MKSIFQSTTILAILVSLLFATTANAQSGRASLRGWVCFDGVAYVDKQPTAKIQLISINHPDLPGASVETDEHGLWNFERAPLGEYLLRISAPGFATWEAPIYISSDSGGDINILLKKPQPTDSQKK